MDKDIVLKHYSRKFVQDEIIRNSSSKEVIGSFEGKGFSKRPDTLQYPNDIKELVKNGITSFHVSEERWSNVGRLEPTLKRKELDELRSGWDLILDIDCNFLEYSMLAAHLLIEALKYQGIKSVTCKFSGNHGFHIAIPFESFPEVVNGVETRTLFPDAPRMIAAYLKDMIQDHLGKEILKRDKIEGVMKKTGKKFSELMQKDVFNPFLILEVDTILISSRHLCRGVYCFNEKSGLVSVPIDPDTVLEFDKETAKVENVKEGPKFLDNSNVIGGEAKKLLVQALDFKIKEEAKNPKYKKDEIEIPTEAVPEDLFPPCINRILDGLEDGKKRSLFLLVNFFVSVGWSYEQIEQRLHEWNKKNPEPLRETYLVGQVRYHKQQKKKILPPNCANGMYYKDMRICLPDSLCEKINNPTNYSKKKAYFLRKKENTGRTKLTDEQKEMRRKHREKMKEETNQ